MTFLFSLRKTALPVLAVFLGGCTSFSADGGFGSISDTAQQRLSQPTRWNRSAADDQRIRQEVQALLGAPLTADNAVRIALINNRPLQAAYSELGIAEADLVQASRLPNPGFSFSRTRSGDDIKVERSLSLSLVRLLTLPATSGIEQRRFEQTRLRLAEHMLRTAALTRKAYYQAVAASQSVQYQEQVQQAAELAHTLAVRMAARGNFSKLDAAREQAFALDANAQSQRARLQAMQQQENLLLLLGLSPDSKTGASPLQLPARLPDLPAQRTTLSEAGQLALQQRLDIQADRLELSALQQSLGLSKASRFINVLDLGYVRNSESTKAAETGYQLSLEIPLFDWGQARVAKAEALYMQAAHKLAASALQAQSEVRVAYAAQQQAYQLARQYQDVLLPLRKRIAEENQLRYNGMLISVFDLLNDAREQATAVNAAIDAARDYWLADCALQLALGGPPEWAAAQQQPLQPKLQLKLQLQPQTPAPAQPTSDMQGHHHE